MAAHLEAASRIGVGLPMRQGSSCIQFMLMIRRLLAQWASGPLGCPRAMGQTEQHLRQKAPGKASAFNLDQDLPPWASRGHTQGGRWSDLRSFYGDLFGFIGISWRFHPLFLC